MSFLTSRALSDTGKQKQNLRPFYSFDWEDVGVCSWLHQSKNGKRNPYIWRKNKLSGKDEGIIVSWTKGWAEPGSRMLSTYAITGCSDLEKTSPVHSLWGTRHRPLIHWLFAEAIEHTSDSGNFISLQSKSKKNVRIIFKYVRKNEKWICFCKRVYVCNLYRRKKWKEDS